MHDDTFPCGMRQLRVCCSDGSAGCLQALCQALPSIRLGPQVERLQRKFTTIHSTLAQQTSGTPKVDSEPSLRASQPADLADMPAKVSRLVPSPAVDYLRRGRQVSGRRRSGSASCPAAISSRPALVTRKGSHMSTVCQLNVVKTAWRTCHLSRVAELGHCDIIYCSVT